MTDATAKAHAAAIPANLTLGFSGATLAIALILGLVIGAGAILAWSLTAQNNEAS